MIWPLVWVCLPVFQQWLSLLLWRKRNFHEIYQKYIESVIGDTLENIELNKKKMFRLLVQQIGYVVRVQAVIFDRHFFIGYRVFARLRFYWPGDDYVSGSCGRLFRYFCNVLQYHFFILF